MQTREESPVETKPTDTRVKCPSGEPEGAEGTGIQAMGSSPGRRPHPDESCPLSLRSTSTCTTYSLEISINTADSGEKDTPTSLRTPPGTAHRPSDLRSPGDKDGQAEELTRFQERLGSCRIESSRGPRTESGPRHAFVSNPGCGAKQEARPAPDGDGDPFYSFVILHAPEDAEEAVRLKTRLELISSTGGATFSEDFAEPGRSAFRCLEDAIGNSAYVMLLLTANFNTRLSETSVDSALINSIEKPHKYNTVIPLLPRTGHLARHDMSLILRSKNPLRETQDDARFQRHVRMLLSPDRLREQRSVWMREQKVKRLQEDRRRIQDQNREEARLRELEEHVRRLQVERERHPPPQNPFQAFPSHAPSQVAPNAWHTQPSCIHIQDARYIMIGSNSTMTVGAAGDSGDED